LLWPVPELQPAAPLTNVKTCSSSTPPRLAENSTLADDRNHQRPLNVPGAAFPYTQPTRRSKPSVRRKLHPPREARLLRKAFEARPRCTASPRKVSSPHYRLNAAAIVGVTGQDGTNTTTIAAQSARLQHACHLLHEPTRRRHRSGAEGKFVDQTPLVANPKHTSNASPEAGVRGSLTPHRPRISAATARTFPIGGINLSTGFCSPLVDPVDP